MERKRIILAVVATLVIVLPPALTAVPGLITDWLWYDSVGFSTVFRTRLLAHWGLALVGLLVSLLWLGGNLWAAARLANRYPAVSRLDGRWRLNVRGQVVVLALALVVLVGLVAGLAVGAEWERVLRFLNAVPFGVSDPVFGKDIGFYVFRWPLLQLVANWWLWMVGAALVTTALIHAGEQIRSAQVRLQPAALVQLTLLAAAFLALRAWDYHLQRYSVLYSVHGALHGAGYTDVHVRLPAYNALAILLAAAAVLMLANIYLRKAWPVWLPLVVWVVASFLALNVAPAVVQRLVVTPDELAQERPYIARSIAFTRQAYGLDVIQEIAFSGEQELTRKDLEANQETLINVRVWDWQPLLLTYRQLQEIRTYYEFGDVDVERYLLAEGPRSVMLAAREMRTDQLAEQAKTWLNEHLIFTHGYGLVLNLVSDVTEEGLPNLLVRDIPPQSSDPALRIDRPEIYFGELENSYVVVGTLEDELDYPQGDTNTYTRYSGSGGVQLNNVWRRLAFSIRFGDLPVLISRSITRESRVLLNRAVRERVSEIVPFLWLDQDPYLVISEGRLYWIQDAYTYTDRYPYSQATEFPGRPANYVRNSVKVVVDAYHGSMTFYAADPLDPLLRSYERIYPGLFTAYDQMPADLREHVRYPEDLFSIQAQMYTTYHMRDPQVFYNREDLWQPAIEVRGGQETVVEPYFVIMRLPGEDRSEFMLTLPLTPAGRDNMIAWLYADSDGSDYGEMGSLQLSKQELIYGPRQIEARIDQDPIISQQLSLWNQRGSQVIRGNMMVIPVEAGLIYVEPVFLQAESGRLPELKRVIVAHGSHIAMRESLSAALEAVFSNEELPPGPAEPVPTQILPSLDGGVAALARSAQEHYLNAQACLATGDWACYGREQDALMRTLDALVSITGETEQ